MKSLILALCLSNVAIAACAAESTPLIHVTGEGEVVTAPDMAQVSVGVTARAEDAALALDQTSQAVAQVVSRLQSEGVDAADVQTGALSLQPIRPPRSTDGTNLPAIIGFEAGNRVRVIVRNLDKLGRILDLVVEDGANQLNGLTFTLKDPEPARSRSRAMAVADAIRRAEELADAAGVELGAIRSISEQSGRGAPVMEMAAARVSDVAIAPGTLAIAARVTMSFEIEQ